MPTAVRSLLARPGKKPFSTSTCHDTSQQIIEPQSIKPDPDSGITNDANLWATETMGNPKYSLELFLNRVRPHGLTREVRVGER